MVAQKRLDPDIPWPVGPFPVLSAAEKMKSLKASLAVAPDPDQIWVLAYGSLMWNPCLQPLETRPAVLSGYQRRFCFWTVVARGTPERPGLGLGLEEAEGQAPCMGLAYRIAPERMDEDLTALWNREMFSGVYVPTWVELKSAGQETFSALTFVTDKSHPQYCPPLTPDQQARIIVDAHGQYGACIDYLRDVVTHLQDLKVSDAALDDLLEKTERMALA